MLVYEILDKKRKAQVLTDEEISFMVDSYTKGEVPDYQMAAFLMAVAMGGMDDAETAALTKCMVKSGEMADLSSIRGVKVDKHSSGGVGDKTSPVVGAIVAACGVPVAKMSGRALGFSGGTLDKLESIPGYTTTIGKERFFEIVNSVGVSIIGQTGNLAPADKKIYALRDVTATVESIPLIASSIMSKKIAGGADAVLLDVKVGNGAFMKDEKSAADLARCMVAIGKSFGKETVALLTQMNQPLGWNVGTALEIAEMIGILKNEVHGDVRELCLLLAANMLYLAGKGSMEECDAMAGQALADGKAFEKFRAMVQAQGGDVSVVDEPSLFPQAKYIEPCRARQAGYIQSFQTDQVGMAALVLGAGRETKDASIDHAAGIRLCVKQGDHVEEGSVLAYLHTSDEGRLARGQALMKDAISIGADKPEPLLLVYKRIPDDG
ncbi:thymidine phosphorylase [Christensenellaceae bacterium OttesenSCG-928-K19]|nr:thymidine phosphorylase [Christensenellaceae bacterium OttesenSCG-928-K19]